MQTFECYTCGKIFWSPRSEEEANAEYEKEFGEPVGTTEVAVICDECYRAEKEGETCACCGTSLSSASSA